jgi:hypothetical protein
VVQHSGLLREAPLPVPAFPLRLPVLVWDTLTTIHWGYRILRGMDATPAERQRAADAATWLGEIGDTAMVAVVTHGVFRRLLAQHFQETGWQVSVPRRRYDFWSVWTVERTGTWHAV